MKTKKSISALMAVLAGLTLTLAGCVSKPSSSSSTASSNKPYISGIKMGYNDKFNAENCNIDDFIDTGTKAPSNSIKNLIRKEASGESSTASSNTTSVDSDENQYNFYLPDTFVTKYYNDYKSYSKMFCGRYPAAKGEEGASLLVPILSSEAKAQQNDDSSANQIYTKYAEANAAANSASGSSASSEQISSDSSSSTVTTSSNTQEYLIWYSDGPYEMDLDFTTFCKEAVSQLDNKTTIQGVSKWATSKSYNIVIIPKKIEAGAAMAYDNKTVNVTIYDADAPQLMNEKGIDFNDEKYADDYVSYSSKSEKSTTDQFKALKDAIIAKYSDNDTTSGHAMSCKFFYSNPSLATATPISEDATSEANYIKNLQSSENHTPTIFYKVTDASNNETAGSLNVTLKDDIKPYATDKSGQIIANNSLVLSFTSNEDLFYDVSALQELIASKYSFKDEYDLSKIPLENGSIIKNNGKIQFKVVDKNNNVQLFEITEKDDNISKYQITEGKVIQAKKYCENKLELQYVFGSDKTAIAKIKISGICTLKDDIQIDSDIIDSTTSFVIPVTEVEINDSSNFLDIASTITINSSLKLKSLSIKHTNFIGGSKFIISNTTSKDITTSILFDTVGLKNDSTFYLPYKFVDKINEFSSYQIQVYNSACNIFTFDDTAGVFSSNNDIMANIQTKAEYPYVCTIKSETTYQTLGTVLFKKVF